MRRDTSAFLAWLKQRHIATGINAPRPKCGLPQRFVDQDDHEEQLRRCLTDDSLPLDVRIVGALVRLYAMPLVRIVELTTDRFHRDETDAYLVIDENAVILPPSLATLIEEQIRNGGLANIIRTPTPDQPTYLLPGRPPSRPRNTQTFSLRLKQYGLPTIGARNTAMLTNIIDLDAVVVADLLGLHPKTAHRWAQYAQTSWAAYLQAREPEDIDTTIRPGSSPDLSELLKE
ncbi:hypothetical protein [Nocardia sp. CY41]|uniref:hypothetical protein n=1 Tax=Nocardia sp. CY41 TaxID=2608686 RepID=UPI001F2C6A98|nr:hypothetical protein [Nocardia sp. CY41]